RGHEASPGFGESSLDYENPGSSMPSLQAQRNCIQRRGRLDGALSELLGGKFRPPGRLFENSHFNHENERKETWHQELNPTKLKSRAFTMPQSKLFGRHGLIQIRSPGGGDLAALLLRRIARI